MTTRADFLDGEVMWTKAPYHPPDLRRLQGAMFLDRPDLWPVTRRKPRQPAPEQRPLFDSEDKAG